MTGNRTKHISYKVAWERMTKSLDAGFYIEAITIQESIIYDRMRSFVEFGEAQYPHLPGSGKTIGDFVQLAKVVNRAKGKGAKGFVAEKVE